MADKGLIDLGADKVNILDLVCFIDDNILETEFLETRCLDEAYLVACYASQSCEMSPFAMISGCSFFIPMRRIHMDSII
jgi:hypothetical protein